MIRQLDITNLQSHKKSTLKFHEGVNVIIGKTDTGKTTIIRALKWLFKNRPTSDGFRSWWGGETKVVVHTEDHCVSRRKDKTTINEYILTPLKESRSITFKAFGTDVPEKIKDALNVSEINLQSQFDQPFLLTSSPGEVASHFNKIAHIDQIDSGLKKVQGFIRVLEQDVTTGEKQIEEFKKDLKKFTNLEKFEIEIEILESMGEEKQQKINQRSKLKKVIKEAREVSEEIEKKEEILKAEDLVNTILDKTNKFNSGVDDSESLIGIVDKLKALEEEMKKKELIIILEDSVEGMLNLFTIKEERLDAFTILEGILDDLEINEEKKKEKETEIKKLEIQFDDEMGDVCILCNQKIEKL